MNVSYQQASIKEVLSIAAARVKGRLTLTMELEQKQIQTELHASLQKLRFTTRMCDKDSFYGMSDRRRTLPTRAG